MHDNEPTTDELAELEAGLSDSGIMVIPTDKPTEVVFYDADSCNEDRVIRADLNAFVPVEP